MAAEKQQGISVIRAAVERGITFFDTAEAHGPLKNVVILGADGNIARHVIDLLVRKNDINLTLFLRNKSRLRNKDVSKCRIIEGDVLNYTSLRKL